MYYEWHESVWNKEDEDDCTGNDKKEGDLPFFSVSIGTSKRTRTKMEVWEKQLNRMGQTKR